MFLWFVYEDYNENIHNFLVMMAIGFTHMFWFFFFYYCLLISGLRLENIQIKAFVSFTEFGDRLMK